MFNEAKQEAVLALSGKIGSTRVHLLYRIEFLISDVYLYNWQHRDRQIWVLCAPARLYFLANGSKVRCDNSCALQHPPLLRELNEHHEVREQPPSQV